MSYMRRGQQVQPDDLYPAPLTFDDAWQAAQAVVHNEGIPEPERVRLMWAILDAAQRLPEGA